MANTAEGGFRFVRMRNGSTVPNVEIMPVANNYGTAIFRGDVLKRVNDGTVAVHGAADAVVYGVADGIVQYNSGGQLRSGNYLPANTTFSPTTVGSPNESLVRVILAKDAIFEVDAATAVADIATAQGLVGNNADGATGSGSTVTGRSGHTLTVAGISDGTAAFRVLEVSKRIDNDVASVNWKVLVSVNETMEPLVGSVTGV
jgi:hypothetical protein